MSKKASSANKGKNENEFESNVGEILSKSEQFIENNKKSIIIGVAAIILVVIAILGIRHGVLLPRERAAEDAIFRGQNYFQDEEWDKALYGDSAQYIGFEAISSQYSHTKTAKLAKAYAGICYFHKGEYAKAIDKLKGFNASENLVSPAILGLIGDCYVEMDQTKEGINYFLKAAKKANDDLISPIYLKKAGLAYESLQEFKKAAEAYTSIQERYPNSREAQDIEKYILRANSNQ